MVTLVTLPPCIIFSLTGFQIGVFAGASNLVPYFQVFMSKGPWFTAPGGAILSAWLSTPPLAASGKFCAAVAAASSWAGAPDMPARSAALIAAENKNAFMFHPLAGAKY